MTITHHPDDATLVAHAAGSLGEAASVVVACHLAWCPGCRKTVRCLERLGGRLIESIEAAPLSAGVLERCLSALDRAPPAETPAPDAGSGDPVLPPVLAHRLGCPMARLRWKRVVPAFGVHHLPLSAGARGTLCLLRIGKGHSFPPHGHSGCEITMVLAGSYTDRFGRFAAGDVADLDPDAEHDLTVDSDEACICLVAMESPTRFKGMLARLVQPLIGL